jgi:hypothetical protein
MSCNLLAMEYVDIINDVCSIFRYYFMKKTLLNPITAIILLLLSILFVSNQIVYGQITVETESAQTGWTPFAPYGTSGWADYTVAGGTGRSVSTTSYKGTFITIANAGISPGTYNITISSMDNHTESTSQAWIQIGQRDGSCKPTSTTICNTTGTGLDTSWIFTGNVVSGTPVFTTYTFTNKTVNALDTIFYYLKFSGGTGSSRGFVDYIQFTSTGPAALKNKSQGLPEFSVYPNPIIDKATITFATDKRTSISMELINIIGQSVKSIVNTDFEAGRHTINFDRQELTSGLYYLKTEYEGKVFVAKIILSK